MRYAYTFPTLFAAAAVAAPVINTRSDAGAFGDVGVGAVVGGDGDTTGVKNAKRDSDSLIGNDNGNHYNDGHLVTVGSVGALKRSEDSLVGGDLIGDDDGDDYDDDDDLLGVLKRSENGLIGDDDGYDDNDLVSVGSLIDLKRSDDGIIGDVGVAAVAGNGDTTGVKNAKREEELLDPELIDVLNPLKRDQNGVIGDVGVAAVAAENGDVIGVKNAKRDDIPDDAVAAESDAESVADAQVADAGQDVLSQAADTAETSQPQEEKTEGTQEAASTDDEEKNLISDVGLGLKALGERTATGVKGHKTDSVLGDVSLGLKVLSDDELVGTSKKRSEDLSIDEKNIVTGLGVADDVESGTPVLGIGNPL